MENDNNECENDESDRHSERNYRDRDSLLAKNLARLKDEDTERRKALMKKLVEKIKKEKHEELKKIKMLGIDKRLAISSQINLKLNNSTVTKLPIIILKTPVKPKLWDVNSKQNTKTGTTSVTTERIQRPKTSLGLGNNKANFYKLPEGRAHEIRIKLEREVNRLQKNLLEAQVLKKQNEKSEVTNKVIQPFKSKYFNPMIHHDQNQRPATSIEIIKNAWDYTINPKQKTNPQIKFSSPRHGEFDKSGGDNTTSTNKLSSSPYRPSSAIAKPKSKASIYFKQSQLSKPNEIMSQIETVEKNKALTTVENGKTKLFNINPSANASKSACKPKSHQIAEFQKLYRSSRHVT